MARILDRWSTALAKPSRWDRRLAVAVAAAFCLALATVGTYLGHRITAWRLLGVYAENISFGDARAITGYWDSVREGQSPYDDFPGKPPNLIFNYPRLWLIPGYLGLGERHTDAFGCVAAAVFLAGAFWLMGRLTSAEAWVYALAVCSPAAMVAIERGNSDEFIFGLVCLGVACAPTRRVLSPVILWLAAALKLFPVFALVVYIRENRRRALTVIGIASVAFLAYVLATLHDIVRVRALTPYPTLFGFGCLTAVDGVGKWLRMHGHEHHLTPLLRGLARSVAIVVALAAGCHGWKRRRSGVPTCGKLDAFRAGALIYLGVFLIGSNYEYRRIFLILCIGQWLAWLREERGFRLPAAVAVVAFLLSAWERWPLANGLPGAILIVPVAEIASWTLFGLLAWFVAATLPDWVAETGTQFSPAMAARRARNRLGFSNRFSLSSQ